MLNKKLKAITGRSIINRIGETFGRLTVLDYDANKHSETGIIHWVCKCECGNVKSIASSSLTRGLTSSCGCLNQEEQKNKRIDLTGKRYGRYTVMKYDESTSNVKSRSYWVCKCDCGNTSTVEGYSLRSGASNSCGCQR